MKFIILHSNRHNDSLMVPVDRIRFVEQTEYGAEVATGHGIPYDTLCVRETVEDIARLIREAEEI